MVRENIQLQTRYQQNMKKYEEADDKTTELLNILDEVRFPVCSNAIAY
jgi:hypothetical protein